MKVCVILTRYPVFSETFIAREILGLERAGHQIQIIALDAWPVSRPNTVHADISAEVIRLSLARPANLLAIFQAWRKLRSLPVWKAALAILEEDVELVGRLAGLSALVKAMVWWRLIADARPDVIYAHWISRPASMARYASCLSGLPWCCSAHARDVWMAGPEVLRDRVASASHTLTCNSQAYELLRDAADQKDKVHLSHHGIDLTRFSPPEQQESTGSERTDPLKILTVGRAVSKKGFDVLLRALALLPNDIDWQLQHVGSGWGRLRLRWLTRRLGLTKRINWLGPVPSRELLKLFRHADLFVLASRVDRAGDQDGLPNVLVEACSQGIACVSTRLPSIEDLVVDGKTGLLVPPEDAAALAKSVEKLARDPRLRHRLGRTAQQQVRQQFDCETSISLVCSLLAATAGKGTDPRGHN